MALFLCPFLEVNVSGKGLQHVNMTYEQYERYYSQKDRAKMDLSDFGDPHKRAFPIRTQQDVYNAARLIGHGDNPDVIKTRIIAIAKRKGFALPDSWQEDEKPKEAAASPSTFKPRTKIATIKTCWLEDDAISLNGRQYPKESVDRLIQSAQLKLSDSNALPITCYLSHEKADQDSTRDIVGKVTQVWREGTRAFASIVVPDTVSGRDFATLAAGGYIRSQSLRASNAVMRVDPSRTFPQVTGESLSLDGIDCTTTPGLSQVARIADVVMESHTPQDIHEVFNAHPNNFLLEEAAMPTVKEDGITAITSGTSVGVTSDDPRDDYSKRQYPIPPDAPHDVFPASLSDVHDHIACAIGMDCAPSTMERAASLKFLGIREAGAKFAGSTKKHLVAAHDGVAKHLGMECADSSNGNDGMQDGDSDDMTSRSKESKEKSTMTPEEAARLLAEAGYTVQPPKTQEQLLQEKFDAMQATLEQKLTEALQSVKPQGLAPQRRSLVEGATAKEPAKKSYYTKGSYLREKMLTTSPEELLDRSRPLPEWMDPERAIKEYEVLLMGLMDATYPLA